MLAPFVSHHMSRYPGIEVQLLEGGAASQSTRLERGEAHLAIMPAGDPRLHGRLLYPVYALAVLRADAVPTKRRTLDVSMLASKPVLLLRREFGSREWFDAACAGAHFRPQVRLESGAPQTLVELAAAGYGVAIVPSTVSIQRIGVSALPLVHQATSLGRWSMIAWNPQRLLPVYARRFADGLLSFVRRSAPGRQHTKHAPPMPRPADPLDTV